MPNYVDDTVSEKYLHKQVGSSLTMAWQISSPLLPSLPLLPFPFSFPSLLLEVGPLNTARGSGECCKLPQRHLGQSHVEIEFGTFWS